jgi:hypothetical protein
VGSLKSQPYRPPRPVRRRALLYFLLLVKLKLTAYKVDILKHRASKRITVYPVTLFKKRGLCAFETFKSGDTANVQTWKGKEKEKENYRQCHSVS